MNYTHALLTEEHHLIRKTVRDFAERTVAPLASKLDNEERFSVELTREMGNLGLFGMTLPEEYGGHNLDTLSYIIAVEELARIDSSQAATLAAHNSLGIWPIYHFGNRKQREKYLPGLCTGKQLWAFGLTEPEAGSDSRGTKTTARLTRGVWHINGSKTFITNGSSPITRGITVQAVLNPADEKKSFVTLLCESDTPGLKQEVIRNKMVWRASDTARLYFDDCKVPDENLLGEVGQGSRIMLETLDAGRLSIAAIGLGLAQGAYEMAMGYAKERKQFGRHLTKFQAIAFKLADMATKIELARSFLYHACWLKDQGNPFGKEAAMAKFYCSEIAREVADEAVQIHGGYGLMKDYPIERFYRDQRLLQIGEGTSEILKLVISRKIGC